MLLDGINKQQSVSDRYPLPVDITADTSKVTAVTGEAVTLKYIANAYLTCGTAGSATYTDYVALTNTGKFNININDKDYTINPDFTGDTSMNDVATSIQTALRSSTGNSSIAVAWSTNHFVITTATANYRNNISVLTTPDTYTVNLAGASWLNGLYGTGVVTKATPTTDAGQAAGTVVIFKLTYSGVLDSSNMAIGNEKDTSLVWTTGTVFPMKYLKECPKSIIEDLRNKEITQIALEVTKNFATGEWCFDHRLSIGFGKKATTGTSDTAAYYVQTSETSGSGGLAANVNITQVAGTTVTAITQDAAFGTAAVGIPVGIMGRYQATPTTYTDGDAAPVLLDANGRVVLSSDIEIGAVELKNGASDVRATIDAANTARTTATTTLVTQPIDAAGLVMGRDAANTARTTATLVNPVQVVDASGQVLNRDAANTARTTATLVTPTQMVGADGTVPPTGSLNTNAPFVKLTDGSNNVSVIATINSLKSDLSSVAGTATVVNGGNRSAGVQTVTLADNDPAVTAVAVPTTLTGGSKTVATSGTAEALGASLATKSIYIRAKATNTGNVYVGDSSVDATTSQQLILAANDAVTIQIANRATVYVDVAVNNEGVDFLCMS